LFGKRSKRKKGRKGKKKKIKENGKVEKKETTNK